MGAPRIAPAPDEKALIVFAAASLTESFGELAQRFEAEHPDAVVSLNFAGSQQLRSQLAQGAEADVFASANLTEIDAAIRESLVLSGTHRIFARNRLVAIVPTDNPGSVVTLADLARPGLKVVAVDNAVPAGRYTEDMLVKMSQDPAYGASFAESVLANVVSRESNVKSVVSKIRLGEADAGFVYATDVTPDAAREVIPLPIPDRINQPAEYPIAVLADAPHPVLAEQFVALVLSEEGQQVLERYGFIRGRAGQP
jgi:molybdate transport system substrate-binding protein